MSCCLLSKLLIWDSWTKAGQYFGECLTGCDSVHHDSLFFLFSFVNYNQQHPEAERLFFHNVTLGNIGSRFCRLPGFILIKIIQSAVSAAALRVDGVM